METSRLGSVSSRRQQPQHSGHDQECENGDPHQQKLIRMPAEPMPYAFPERALIRDPLAQKLVSIADEIVSNVRFTLRDSRIAVASFLRFPRQRQRRSGYLHFRLVRTSRHLRHSLPVPVAAFKIHRSVGSCRITPQNLVKRNQGLQILFPRRLKNVLEGLNIGCDTRSRSTLGLPHDGEAPLGNALEQNQFQRRNQGSDLVKLQWRYRFKGHAEGRKLALGESRVHLIQKGLCNHKHPWQDLRLVRYDGQCRMVEVAANRAC